MGLLPWDYLHRHAATTCAAACTTGLIATLALVLPAAARAESPGLAADLFLGRILNPRRVVAGRLLDVKMYLYLVGAVHLQLNILSYAAAHYLDPLASSSASSSPEASFPDAASLGAPLAAALLTWFVAEYLYFEDVHLYTYDLFAERVGFKLTWGCLCFYPFFYALPVLAAAGRTSSSLLTTAATESGQYPSAAAATVVYFSGWALSRGANLQKFWFKQRSRAAGSSSSRNSVAAAAASANASTTVLRSADGRTTLFCGGLWGRARHVNYLGEILEAVGIAMAAGVGTGGPAAVWAAWLYPLYYVGLLVPRERDDDARCRDKYGELWEAYCRRVPWRIVPYVY